MVERMRRIPLEEETNSSQTPPEEATYLQMKKVLEEKIRQKGYGDEDITTPEDVFHTALTRRMAIGGSIEDPNFYFRISETIDRDIQYSGIRQRRENEYVVRSENEQDSFLPSEAYEVEGSKNPEEIVMQEGTAYLVHQAFEELPKHYVEFLELCYIQEKTIEEIAKIYTHLTKERIRSIIRYAERELSQICQRDPRYRDLPFFQDK